MNFSRVIFRVAAIYGFIVLLPQYFMETKIGRDYPPPITHPEHFYGFVGVALAWQVLFVIIARDPQRYRLAMLPAALEKVAFGVAVIALYLQGRVAPMLVGAAVVDLLFATLFLVAFGKTQKEPS
jgi:hypothetical protein